MNGMSHVEVATMVQDAFTATVKVAEIYVGPDAHALCREVLDDVLSERATVATVGTS